MGSFLPSWLLGWICLTRYVIVSWAVVGDLQGDSALTLSQGTSGLNGYLAMKKKNSEWISICKNSWSETYTENADVACRQLKLGLPRKNQLHWNNSLETSLNKFTCAGNEDSLQDCNYNAIDNCSQDSQLWLECSGFQEIKLRLTGRDKFEQGRVEIFYNGQWGTICDQDWTLADANIVCRTFLNSKAIDAYKSTQDDHDDGHPIYIEDMTCTGTEKTILDCDFKGPEVMHDCTHKDEVWVDCENNVIISGGQSVSASLITALSIAVLLFLLVFEYIGLRRYQRWKAERRARRQNLNVRFHSLPPGNLRDPQDQTAARGPIEFQQMIGVEYPGNRTRPLANENQSNIPYSNIVPSLIIDEPPPPYSSVAQNGTNSLNEGFGATIEDLQQANTTNS